MLPRLVPRLFASLLLLALLVELVDAAPAGKRQTRRAVESLPETYRQWVADVELLISDDELGAFLELTKDYQRKAFINRFWEARNPDPGAPTNRFKERYYARLEEARERYGDAIDDRYRIFVLHGEAASVEATDCGVILWPLEIWKYGYSATLGRGFTVIFYQRSGGGPFRIWRPSEGYDALVALRQAETNFASLITKHCTARDFTEIDDFLYIFEEYVRNGAAGPIEAEVPAEIEDPEWLATFYAFSTDTPADVEPLSAELDVRFPGRHQSRTVVEGSLLVPLADAERAELGGRRSYNFELTGEVLREEELFESFRYRFDLPPPVEGTEELVLTFERYLRAGIFDLVLKLEDLNRGSAVRLERRLEVPRSAVAAADAAGESEPVELPEAVAIELLSEGADLVSGYSRFTAAVSGDGVAKVRFLVDDQPVLTKTRPPYSVELDLGSLPRTRAVRVVALDSGGEIIATDEALLNPGEHAFVARLVEPRRGGRYAGSVRARAEIEVPEGTRLERVEFYRNDERVATLFQPPFTLPIELAEDGLAFVRVVAFLADGNSTEDLVVFNSPQALEDVQVRFVELFASVLDGAGRPLLELERDVFRVFENGQEQEILRFERLDDLPMYAGLLVDTSASMADSLEEVRRAALGFFEDSVRPRDRAAVITFSDTPRLAAPFTSDLDTLAGALAGLKAERSTALYDSMMFALYYFRGVKGQRALLVLSDGDDRRSKATFEEALAFARGAEVTVYTIGLKSKSARGGRGQLEKLAAETGGRAFFIKSAAELGAIYGTIQSDLRSRYLLAYQSSAGGESGFRAIDVKVAVPNAEVVAMSGYDP